MQGKIYILQDQSNLSPMEERPWDAEHKLQQLIAEYPDLLGGDQIDVENHRRWLLVTREMPMQGEEPNTTTLSLDHLFLDQDGIPTLVEVKRGSNAQVRREVVGQLLDYAAIATSSLNVRDIQAAPNSNGAPADSKLEKFLGEDANVEEFWQRVQSNLDRGQLRLIVLADSIPAELRRVVEFLNRQMNPAEFLAVEVKQFEYEGQKFLVPREKPKGDAVQFASIEFFHWLAIALSRRRHERFQRIDNNGRHRMSPTMIEVARFKPPPWPLVCSTRKIRAASPYCCFPKR